MLIAERPKKDPLKKCEYMLSMLVSIFIDENPLFL